MASAEPFYVVKLLFSTANASQRPRPDPPSDPTECSTKYRSLPMVKGLTPALRGLFRSVPVKIAVTSRRSINDFFTRSKDKTPTIDLSNVIYCIECNDCEECYVGMTGQRLKSRLSQHRRDVENKKNTTALCSHTTELDHTVDFEGVTVLASDAHYHRRAFKEMCFIKSKTNAMNSPQICRA